MSNTENQSELMCANCHKAYGEHGVGLYYDFCMTFSSVDLMYHPDGTGNKWLPSPPVERTQDEPCPFEAMDRALEDMIANDPDTIAAIKAQKAAAGSEEPLRDPVCCTTHEWLDFGGKLCPYCAAAPVASQAPAAKDEPKRPEPPPQYEECYAELRRHLANEIGVGIMAVRPEVLERVLEYHDALVKAANHE